MGALSTKTNEAEALLSTEGKQHVLADCVKPAGATLTDTITGSSNSLGAVNADFIDVQADTLCFIEQGAATPTAAIGTSYPIQPGVKYRLPHVAGEEVAVIGTAGNIWVTPMA